MKVWALMIVIASLVFHITIIANDIIASKTPASTDWVLLASLLIILLLWLFMVNKDWVKIPADAYAERLYEILNDLK